VEIDRVQKCAVKVKDSGFCQVGASICRRGRFRYISQLKVLSSLRKFATDAEG
jgi:hypothetical protein